MPGFVLDTGEKQFAGIHEARESFVFGAGDVAKMFSGFGENHDGEIIMRVARFALEDEKGFGDKGWFEVLNRSVTRPCDGTFDKHDLPGKRHEGAILTKGTVHEREKRGINWNQRVFHHYRQEKKGLAGIY